MKKKGGIYARISYQDRQGKWRFEEKGLQRNYLGTGNKSHGHEILLRTF